MKNILLLIFSLFIIVSAKAQDAIKNVFVETYYVSDAKDATDTNGGFLEPGSKTYRIYIQMKPGCKLLSLYGDKNNTLKIKSTAPIFNNIDYGVSFAKDMRVSDLRKNTVALDSWLTLGQVTKKASNTYFGVLKSQDNDGSIIGGVNNDGGSGTVQGGLLTNNDPLAGPAITSSDGMDTLANVPSNWFSKGFIDVVSGEDSTIFGSARSGSEFISNDAYLSNTGAIGGDPATNMVLVAQLTTKGEISFELNVQVSDPDVNNGYRSYYVAKGIDSTYKSEQKIINVSPYLKYPIECGCTDLNFLEYNKKYLCSAMDSCKTRIVLGCMDTKACNYNPEANYNVVYMCCYPGLCYDRDIALACPGNGDPVLQLDVYPNPAKSQITIRSSEVKNKESKYVIYNYYGRVVLEKELGLVDGKVLDDLNVSDFEPGIYLVRLFTGNTSDSRMFIKN